jgi:hypothetical protein
VRSFPSPLSGIGGEFLNRKLFAWCREQGIRFIRGRLYRKDGHCFVEQKNP